MGGGDKALLQVGEWSMLDRVVNRLGAQTSWLVLNTNGDVRRFFSFDLPIVPDATPGFHGPLSGLLAGMRWAERNTDAAWVVTVPCDTPFLPDNLVNRFTEELAAGAEIAVCRSRGRLHPIIGLWPIALADALEAWLSGQPERAAHAWLASRRWSAVDFAMEGDLDPFFNVNTPDDLVVARRYASTLP